MLPSFYSDPDKPVSGIFFRDQALAVSASGITTGVVYVEPRSLRRFAPRALITSHFQVHASVVNGMNEVRMHGWNTHVRSHPGGLVWTHLTLRLYDAYVRRFGIPDLVHAHNALYAGYAAYRINERFSVPYVVTEHSSTVLKGGLRGGRKATVIKAYGKAARVISVSSALDRAVCEYVEGDKQVVIPNLVDTDYFRPPATEPPKSPLTYLVVANLKARKRIDLLITAFGSYYARNRDIRLVIGGDGPCRRELEQLCGSLGITSQVTFLGELTREGVRDALWSAHVFVLPSAIETFGVVLIEALATGLPVLATRSGGTEDIVTDFCGMLVERDTVELLERALEDICETRHRYERAEIRRAVVATYGTRRVSEQLVRLYEEVLSGRVSPAGRGTPSC